MHGVLKGFKKWSDLQSLQPSLDEVQQLTAQIAETFSATETAEAAQTKHSDDWLVHSIYFMWGALFFLCEFEQAVSHADAGQVLQVLKFWSLAFCGVRQHNYACECVEILIGGWIGADLILNNATIG